MDVWWNTPFSCNDLESWKMKQRFSSGCLGLQVHKYADIYIYIYIQIYIYIHIYIYMLASPNNPWKKQLLEIASLFTQICSLDFTVQKKPSAQWAEFHLLELPKNSLYPRASLPCFPRQLRQLVDPKRQPKGDPRLNKKRMKSHFNGCQNECWVHFTNMLGIDVEGVIHVYYIYFVHIYR